MQVCVLHDIYRRNGARLFLRYVAEDSVPKSPRFPIVPKGRIAVLPTRQFLQINVGVEVVIRITLLYLAEIGIHLAMIVYVVLKQIRAYRAVLYGQRASAKRLVVILDILVKRVACHSAYLSDVGIRVVFLDIVRFEYVEQRSVFISAYPIAEIPRPIRGGCEVAHSHVFACAVTYILIAVSADIHADICLHGVEEVLIARDDDILGLVFIPLGFNALQCAVDVEILLRHGEVDGVYLVLIPCAFARRLGAVECVLHIERYRFQTARVTRKRAFGIAVRSVSRRIAGEFVCRVDRILFGVLFPISDQLYAGNIISPLIAVHSVRKRLAVYRYVLNLELIE